MTLRDIIRSVTPPSRARTAILVRIPPGLLAAFDETWQAGGRRSRNAAVLEAMREWTAREMR